MRVVVRGRLTLRPGGFLRGVSPGCSGLAGLVLAGLVLAGLVVDKRLVDGRCGAEVLGCLGVGVTHCEVGDFFLGHCEELSLRGGRISGFAGGLWGADMGADVFECTLVERECAVFEGVGRVLYELAGVSVEFEGPD